MLAPSSLYVQHLVSLAPISPFHVSHRRSAPTQHAQPHVLPPWAPSLCQTTTQWGLSASGSPTPDVTTASPGLVPRPALAGRSSCCCPPDPMCVAWPPHFPLWPPLFLGALATLACNLPWPSHAMLSALAAPLSHAAQACSSARRSILRDSSFLPTGGTPSQA